MKKTKKYHNQIQTGKLDPQSLLYEVANNRNYKCVDLLSSTYQDGESPLHLASSRGHYQCVEQLLKYESDPNIKDKNVATPLHIASKGSVKIRDVSKCWFHIMLI
jgi:hypothetical protein